jgi:hypothetical protein
MRVNPSNFKIIVYSTFKNSFVNMPKGFLRILNFDCWNSSELLQILYKTKSICDNSKYNEQLFQSFFFFFDGRLEMGFFFTSLVSVPS